MRGGHILSENVCDGIVDCPNDKSDELCTCYKNNILNYNKSNTCKIGYDTKKKKFCSYIYYLSTKGTCQKYQSAKHSDNKTELICDKVICYDGKSIDVSLLDDLIFDCGPEGENEPILISLLRYEIYVPCSEPNMIPCKEGHSKCYFLKDVCSYKLSKHNNLILC